MGPQSNNQASALSGQNLWLRLLILVLALFAALDASWRQLGMLMALYCLFMLLDFSLYPKLLRGTAPHPAFSGGLLGLRHHLQS